MRDNIFKFFLLLIISISFLVSTKIVCSQTKEDEDVELFQADQSTAKDALKQKKLSIMATDAPAKQELAVKAPNVEFLKETGNVKATGGAIVSGKGVQAQAQEAIVNTETKTGQLSGKVLFSGQSATISATDATVNFDDETGEFKTSEFEYADGGYEVRSTKAFKLSETRYKLFDSKFSTCQCADNSCPWSIDSDESRITQEGYVVTKNTTLKLWDTPVLYTPIFAFPAKMERASGLLVPSFGFSSKDGFKYRQPIFLVFNDSTDARLTPFTETKTRNGVLLDTRKAFSKDSKIDSNIIFSNESARGDDLRGTLIDGVVDPNFDTNRFGLYYNQIWKASETAPLPLRFIADGHYTSDGLLIKEIGNDNIGDPTSRFLTSTVVLRSALGEYFSGEILGEGTQPIIGAPTEDDTVFQRAPEASLSFLKSFQTFGSNPYGLRLVSKGSLIGTSFMRDEGYEGLRTTFNPTASVPFHFKNYLQGSVGGGVWAKKYSLSETNFPFSEDELDDGQSSNVPIFQSGIGTAFERVYDLPEENILTTLTSLGASNQDLKLTRVKNVIEPIIRYTYVPDITQDDLPVFDSLDRISEKSLVRYGVGTSLLGRYVPRKDALTDIPELTPEKRDLPRFDDIATIPDFGEANSNLPVAGDISQRSGEIRQLATLSIDQGYDWSADHRREVSRENGGTEAVYSRTDLTTALGVSPSPYTSLKVETYYNDRESRFTGWGALGKFLDDRGDNISARYSFKGPVLGDEHGDPTIDQIDGGIEAVVSERVRLGTYVRRDFIEDEFISRRAAIRILSSCDCWHFDIGYSQKSNPDKQTFYLTFSFTGLGDVTQDLYGWSNDE